jgi:integrase
VTSYARQYPGVSPYQDRHGKRRWRFQRRGVTRALGSDYGSEEFERRYREACEAAGFTPAADRPAPLPSRCMARLVASFRASPQYQGWKASTRRTWDGKLTWIATDYADRCAVTLDRDAVMKLMAKQAAKEINGETVYLPGSGNQVHRVLGMLMEHAIALGWRIDNPVRHVRKYKAGTGAQTWTEGQIARFFAAHAPGSVAHLAVTVMLYTGSARADACRMGWQNVQSNRITYRRLKTGQEITLPIHPRLAAALATVPRTRLLFLGTLAGKPRSPDALGVRLREWCEAAGLPNLTAHGLRKAMGRRLAEAGASAPEIMAVMGHRSIQQAEAYIREFSRANAATAAIARLDGGT